MAADNLLVLVVTQTEGDKVLSKLTLEYPNLPNDQANMLQLGYLDALIKKTYEFSAIKAGGELSPGQAKK